MKKSKVNQKTLEAQKTEETNELYPIYYEGKWWHEKDCHDVFVAFYHTKDDLGFGTSVYVGDGERIAPDGWI